MKPLKRLLTPVEGLLRVYSSPRPLRPFFVAREYSNTPRRLNRRVPFEAPPQPVERTDPLADWIKDEDIDTAFVQVKQSDGTLAPAEQLRNILRQIDRRTHVVVQRSKLGEREHAVVEICDRTDLMKTKRDREEIVRQLARSQKDAKPKQLEVNWAIADNDLELKLKQLAQFLEKGKKVEILLASKRRQRKATEEEGNEVLKKIRSKIEDIGAKEIKEMEGAVLKQSLITVKKVGI